MRLGDEVQIGQTSCTLSQLGMVDVSGSTNRIPLNGKVGLVLSVAAEGETVHVQFNDYPVPQQFHSNSVVNLSLTLSPTNLVMRGIKKPLTSIEPLFSIVPKTVVDVELTLPIRATNPALEPLHSMVHTGRGPWVGKEVRIVGLNDGGATVKHHKGENGSVLDVNCDDSLPSGLAITVRLDSGRDFCADYSRVRRLDNGKFLHDNGACMAPTYDLHFPFKLGYQPQYTESEILKGYPPRNMSLLRAGYRDHRVGNSSSSEGAVEIQASGLEGGSGLTTRSIAGRSNGSKSPDSPEDAEEMLLHGGGSPLHLVPATPFPEFTSEILDPRIRNALPRRQLLLAFRGETKDRIITLKEGTEGFSDLYYKQKGIGLMKVDPQDLSITKRSYGITSPSFCNGLFVIVRGLHTGKLARRLFGTLEHKWVLQVVRLEPQESPKGNRTVPRFKESIEEGESAIVVTESSIALVHQMPDEQAYGIKLIEDRQDAAENEWYNNGCPDPPLSDPTPNLDCWSL